MASSKLEEMTMIDEGKVLVSHHRYLCTQLTYNAPRTEEEFLEFQNNETTSGFFATIGVYDKPNPHSERLTLKQPNMGGFYWDKYVGVRVSWRELECIAAAVEVMRPLMGQVKMDTMTKKYNELMTKQMNGNKTTYNNKKDDFSSLLFMNQWMNKAKQ